jgi:hypothetical protein
MFAPTTFLVLAAALMLAGPYLYTKIFPAYSAEYVVIERHASVGLKFYWVWAADRQNDGRFFSVDTAAGSISHPMCGFDWAHWARTNIYLAGGDKIALIGPQHCDYVIALDTLTVSRAFKIPSDDWTYLGAFDFVEHPNGPGTRALRFIPSAEQPECIEDSEEPQNYDWAVRNSARRSSCPR